MPAARNASSARCFPAWARATSISSARSAVSARIVTFCGSTSAKPQATARRFVSAPDLYVISPTASSVIRGAWPGNTPMYPVLAGISMYSALSFTTNRSGVTTSSWICSAMNLCRRRAALHLLGFFQHFLNGTFHIEGLLGDFVVLAFDDFLEAAHSVRNFHVAALTAGKLFGHVERLREKLLHLARSSDGHFVIFAQLFNTENGNDVLQILVALQYSLDALGHFVVLLADHVRVENTRSGSQGINRGIDSDLRQRTRKHRGGVEVSKGRGWRRISEVVGGNVNCLHRGDGALFRGGDRFLQLAHFGGEVRLIAHG